MKFRARHHITVWPFPTVRINGSRRSFFSLPHYTSTSIGFPHWVPILGRLGWNSLTGFRFDTPGQGSYRS